MGKLGKALEPLNFSFGREDAVKAGRFLLYFIVFYLAATVAISALLPVQSIEFFFADNVLSFLRGQGYSGAVSVGETAVISLANGRAIEISGLCTGQTEILVIVGAIIASAGISWRKRIIGAALGGLAAIAFNYVRIVVTALLILGGSDLQFIELAHNLFFRLFLFVTIAVLYIGWFYWAARAEVVEKKDTKA